MALFSLHSVIALLLLSLIYVNKTLSYGSIGYGRWFPYYSDCSTGFCPVRVLDWDGERPICPPRYRFNIDVCVPTSELCYEAHKHRLYCSTDKRDQ